MITVDVNSQSVLEVLTRLQSGLLDMSPAMANVAQGLASEAERQFIAQSGPTGAWSGLSEKSTIPMRTARGTWPGQILKISGGGLAGSIQTEYGNNFARVGTNKPHAAMHMFGGQTSAASMIPGKRIPARPFLPFHPDTGELSSEAERTVLEVLDTYFARLTDE